MSVRRRLGIMVGSRRIFERADAACPWEAWFPTAHIVSALAKRAYG